MNRSTASCADMSPDQSDSTETDQDDSSNPPADSQVDRPSEYGGRRGLDPVRYGDWEKNGRCIDF